MKKDKTLAVIYTQTKWYKAYSQTLIWVMDNRRPFILISRKWEKSFVKQTSRQSHCGKPAKACSSVLYSSPTLSWLFSTISLFIVRENCRLWALTHTVEKTISLQIKWLHESIYSNITKCMTWLIIRFRFRHLLHERLKFFFCFTQEIATCVSSLISSCFSSFFGASFC